jgi:prephenate dehydrogenase
MERLGLVGLGAFGRLVAKELSGYFNIKACDADRGATRFAASNNLQLCPLEEVARAKCVVISVPIQSLEVVTTALAPYLPPRDNGPRCHSSEGKARNHFAEDDSRRHRHH